MQRAQIFVCMMVMLWCWGCPANDDNDDANSWSFDEPTDALDEPIGDPPPVVNPPPITEPPPRMDPPPPIMDPPPPASCDDNSQYICDIEPPVCPRGSIVAVRNGCYDCVDPETCDSVPIVEPPPEPVCVDRADDRRSCVAYGCPGFERCMTAEEARRRSAFDGACEEREDTPPAPICTCQGDSCAPQPCADLQSCGEEGEVLCLFDSNGNQGSCHAGSCSDLDAMVQAAAQRGPACTSNNDCTVVPYSGQRACCEGTLPVHVDHVGELNQRIDLAQSAHCTNTLPDCTAVICALPSGKAGCNINTGRCEFAP